MRKDQAHKEQKTNFFLSDSDRTGIAEWFLLIHPTNVPDHLEEISQGQEKPPTWLLWLIFPSRNGQDAISNPIFTCPDFKKPFY